MLYSLSSLSPEIWGDTYNPKKSKRPTTIADALASMPTRAWNAMARDVFRISGDCLDIDTVIDKIAETDTCTLHPSSITVYIDEEHYYAVRVYENTNEV